MANFNIQLMLIDFSCKVFGIAYAWLSLQKEITIMKRMIAMFIAALLLVMIIPQNAYAAEQITPSGISYDDIGIEIDSYMKEYEVGLVSVGTCVLSRNFLFGYQLCN